MVNAGQRQPATTATRSTTDTRYYQDITLGRGIQRRITFDIEYKCPLLDEYSHHGMYGFTPSSVPFLSANAYLSLYAQVTPNTTPYKPSPLSFGSPRTSPFRRPSVAASPNTVIRPNTPGSPGSKGPTPIQSPSKLKQSHVAEDGSVFSDSQISPLVSGHREVAASPTRASHGRNESMSSMMGSKLADRPAMNSDTLSRLPQAQLREMREAFQVLDRDNDGQVNREDVADILLNLGTAKLHHAPHILDSS